jgi:parvulin-like peptidyl-prolyl isomerase
MAEAKRMKKPKIKKPKLPVVVKRPIRRVKQTIDDRRGKSTEEKLSDAIGSVPRITNETVSEHREEVLSSARKYIYPLEHSKHRIVRVSLALLSAAILGFFVLTTFSLYKSQNTGGFVYDVTRIVPFPVAKAGSSWVSYESYLFELRRNMHYYQTQQQANFSSKDGKDQLQRLKRQAMDQVIQDAYIKQLAKQNGVSVTNQNVNNQLAIVRSQNRLGSNNRVFREVLKEFWGWSEADFKRELKQQLLKQAVASKLDIAANRKAQAALQQLNTGVDFAKLAGDVSEDQATKGSGGQYPSTITVGDRGLPPAVTDALFKLKPGQISSVINTGYTLEILKLIDNTNGTAHAAHIQFNLKDVSTFVKEVQDQHPSHQYIKF